MADENNYSEREAALAAENVKLRSDLEQIRADASVWQQEAKLAKAELEKRLAPEKEPEPATFTRTVTNDREPFVVKLPDGGFFQTSHFSKKGEPVLVISGETTPVQVEAILAPFDLVPQYSYRDAGCVCIVVAPKPEPESE